MHAPIKKKLALSSGIVLGSIVISTIAIFYYAGTIATNAKKIASDRAATNQQTGVLTTLSHLKKEAPDAAQYKTAMDKILPTQDRLISFGAWMDAAAAANQVTVKVQFIGLPQLPAGINATGSAPFSFDATGSLANLESFLQYIESQDPGFFLQIGNFILVDQTTDYEIRGTATLLFQ